MLEAGFLSLRPMSFAGKHHSDETRALIGANTAARLKGRPKSEAHRARIGAANRRRFANPAARERVRTSNLVRWADPALRARHRTAFLGHPVDDETRAKLSRARRAHVGTPGCGCWVCGPKAPTTIETFLCEIILAEFPEVRAEEPFGPYRVDAYLPPPYHLAFEADGEYWHRLPGRQEHYEKRDAYLLAHFGLPVVRLSEREIRELAPQT